MLSVFKNTQKNEWYLLAVKFYFLSDLSLKWNGLDGLRVNACNIDKQRGSAQNIYEWLLQLCESSAVCLWSLFNSCQISQHSWGWSGLLEFVLSGRTSRWLWISVRLFTRTCPRLFRYWYRVTLRVSRLTCTKCVLHMTLSQVNFHIIDYANLQELHVKWQHLVFFFSEYNVVKWDIWRMQSYSEIFKVCWDVALCVWWFLSGYRAILAEPKNKSSESFEHEYYSNNARQEPRGNVFPFCKSLFFILKITCSPITV